MAFDKYKFHNIVYFLDIMFPKSNTLVDAFLSLVNSSDPSYFQTFLFCLLFVLVDDNNQCLSSMTLERKDMTHLINETNCQHVDDKKCHGMTKLYLQDMLK